MRGALITITLLGMALLPPAALALRCGNALVQEGDHVIDVHRACGEPAFAEAWLEEKYVLVRPHMLLPYRQAWRTVSVRVWTYNFGPRRFMQMVRFEDGIVVEIEGLERGYLD